MKKPIMIAFAATAALGCKKETKPNAEPAASTRGSEQAPPPAPAPGDTMPAAFAPWDIAARKAAWQGAWAGDGFALGNNAVWLVEGNKVTFFDRKGEQHFELTMDSPCTAGFSAKDASGGSSGWTTVYTLKDGQLITGLGDAGSRKGDKTIVCGGGAVFMLDGSTCTVWENNFKRWESKPGECGYKQDQGKEVFWYKLHDYESKLLVEGDVIWSEQLSRVHATKHPDLAAAKAAQKL